jgi:hypothetical protein
MALPALVLVRRLRARRRSFGTRDRRIHWRAPELIVFAVDLPGRRGKPWALLTLTIAEFVESVVDDIEEAGPIRLRPEWGSNPRALPSYAAY